MSHPNNKMLIHEHIHTNPDLHPKLYLYLYCETICYIVFSLPQNNILYRWLSPYTHHTRLNKQYFAHKENYVKAPDGHATNAKGAGENTRQFKVPTRTEVEKIANALLTAVLWKENIIGFHREICGSCALQLLSIWYAVKGGFSMFFNLINFLLIEIYSIRSNSFIYLNNGLRINCAWSMWKLFSFCAKAVDLTTQFEILIFQLEFWHWRTSTIGLSDRFFQN